MYNILTTIEMKCIENKENIRAHKLLSIPIAPSIGLRIVIPDGHIMGQYELKVKDVHICYDPEDPENDITTQMYMDLEDITFNKSDCSYEMKRFLLNTGWEIRIEGKCRICKESLYFFNINDPDIYPKICHDCYYVNYGKDEMNDEIKRYEDFIKSTNQEKNFPLLKG